MAIRKETKIRLLENFYSLDYIYFGKPVTEVDVCCPALTEEYLQVKGALLSTVLEMYKIVSHVPKTIRETVNTKKLHSMAKKSAKIARENCEKLVTTESGKADIKREVSKLLAEDNSLVPDKVVAEKIREKAFSLATDNLLVARTLAESKNYSRLNEWEGQIIEDAYKVLRDSLVESAMDIIRNS